MRFHAEVTPLLRGGFAALAALGGEESYR